jgi:YesN/AraC family two-component response regulator
MHTSPPDVLVSDVMMPEMDGFALCEAVKADDDLRTIPVLLLTARAEVDDTVEGLQCGADDYLTKPFDVRELRERVDRLLKMRDTLQNEYAQIVRIDAAGVEVDDKHASFVEAVLTAIHASIDDPDFTVDRLADAVALGRRQLTRRLRDAMDETPAALIRRIRLEQAADQLETADTPRIADIAYAVGFRTVSHFSKAFKKHFGCPPSRYPDDA